MSIKQNGGVFGRNPTFNDVTIEGDLIINGEVFTGLDFQGSWNASTNSPTLASSTGTNGEFYIVSVAGATDLNGITNWGIGDWAIFNGTVWQRVEGGADGNFDDVTIAGTLGVAGDYSSTTLGTSNLRLGVGAGDNIVSGGNYNTVVGDQAGTSITTGSGQTAVGFRALLSSNTGLGNVAVGYEALYVSAATGSVAVGYQALRSSGGSLNTALGFQAGIALGTGATNTVIGSQTGYALTSGGNNTFVGKDTGRTGSPGGEITTASNNIVLGDESIATANIQVDWTVASDARDKTDFTPLDLGLDFVNALAPVTYKWDKRSKYGDKTSESYDLAAQTPDGTHKEDWLDIGFKAQDVEALEIAAGYDKSNNTNLVSSHASDGKQMGLQYSKFVPILVKAIQEQNALIEALTTRIETLEGQ